MILISTKVNQKKYIEKYKASPSHFKIEMKIDFQ